MRVHFNSSGESQKRPRRAPKVSGMAYEVTAASKATPWANLKHKASPEKRERLKQVALAELDAKTISERPRDSEAEPR